MNNSSFDWIIPIGLSAIASNVPAPPNSRSHVRRGISYSDREATISYSATLLIPRVGISLFLLFLFFLFR